MNRIKFYFVFLFVIGLCLSSSSSLQTTISVGRDSVSLSPNVITGISKDTHVPTYQNNIQDVDVYEDLILISALDAGTRLYNTSEQAKGYRFPHSYTYKSKFISDQILGIFHSDGSFLLSLYNFTSSVPNHILTISLTGFNDFFLLGHNLTINDGSKLLFYDIEQTLEFGSDPIKFGEVTCDALCNSIGSSYLVEDILFIKYFNEFHAYNLSRAGNTLTYTIVPMSGLKFAFSQRMLSISNEGTLYNLTDLADPQSIAQVFPSTPNIASNNPWLYIENNVSYLLENGELAVYNITDPNNTEYLFNYTIGIQEPFIVRNDTIYIPNGLNGLEILTVESNFISAQETRYSYLGDVSDIAKHDNLLFTTTNRGQIEIFNISNGTPVFIKSYEPSVETYSDTQIEFIYPFLYVGLRTELVRVNMTDFENITKSVLLSDLNNTSQLLVTNDVLAVSDSNELRLFTVDTFMLIDEITSNNRFAGIKLFNNELYVATETNLLVYDISDLNSFSFTPTRNFVSNKIKGFDLDISNIYLLANDEFKILSNDNNLSQISEINPAYVSRFNQNYIKLVDNFVLISDGTVTVYYDVFYPEVPVKLGESSLATRNVISEQNTLYEANGLDGLSISSLIQGENPPMPSISSAQSIPSSLSIPSSASSDTKSVSLSGSEEPTQDVAPVSIFFFIGLLIRSLFILRRKSRD